MPDQDVRQAIRVLQRHNFEGLSDQELLSFVDSALACFKKQKSLNDYGRGINQTEPHCLICEKRVNCWHDTDKNIYPLFAGTTFESSGSYGCTVFDPTNHERLQIFICNECIIASSHSIYHIEINRHPDGSQFKDTKRDIFEDRLRNYIAGGDPYHSWGDYVRKHLPERKDI